MDNPEVAMMDVVPPPLEQGPVILLHDVPGPKSNDARTTRSKPPKTKKVEKKVRPTQPVKLPAKIFLNKVNQLTETTVEVPGELLWVDDIKGRRNWEDADGQKRQNIFLMRFFNDKYNTSPNTEEQWLYFVRPTRAYQVIRNAKTGKGRKPIYLLDYTVPSPKRNKDGSIKSDSQYYSIFDFCVSSTNKDAPGFVNNPSFDTDMRRKYLEMAKKTYSRPSFVDTSEDGKRTNNKRKRLNTIPEEVTQTSKRMRLTVPDVSVREIANIIYAKCFSRDNAQLVEISTLPKDPIEMTQAVEGWFGSDEMVAIAVLCFSHGGLTVMQSQWARNPDAKNNTIINNRLFIFVGEIHNLFQRELNKPDIVSSPFSSASASPSSSSDNDTTMFELPELASF